eukprot:TRINITY_DN22303_c0_g1_i2.p1 TRINITY_DN22303_c0_g1~~TRINITY_DN22303_c0_g1_i2.p1  ORF type:complete len:507 (+),score=121.89 TRINITY_DN22303_c0_g1_i2:70-1521(+)
MGPQHIGTSHGGFEFYGLPLVEREWAPHEAAALHRSDVRRAAPPDWRLSIHAPAYLGPSDPCCAESAGRRVDPDPRSDAVRPDVPSIPGCPGPVSSEHWAERAAQQGSDESRVDAAMTAVRERRAFTAALPSTPGRGGGTADVLYLRLHAWELREGGDPGLYPCAAEAVVAAGTPDGSVEQWVECVLPDTLPLAVQLKRGDAELAAAAEAAAAVAQPVPDSVWDRALGRADQHLRWRARMLGDVAADGWRAALALWVPRMFAAGGTCSPGAEWTQGLLRTAHAARAAARRSTEARAKEVAWSLAVWAAAPPAAPAEQPQALSVAAPEDPQDAKDCIAAVAASAAARVARQPPGRGLTALAALDVICAPLMYLDGLADAVPPDCHAAAATRFAAAHCKHLGAEPPQPQPTEPVEGELCLDDLALLLPQERSPACIMLAEAATRATARRPVALSGADRDFALAARKALRGACPDAEAGGAAGSKD